MRCISLFTTCVLLNWLALTTASAADTTVTVAPDFVINTPSLQSSIKGLKGKVIYVDFWASWCKPCRQSFPWMNAIQQQYAAQGLQIIAVNLDAEHELAETFLQHVPATMPVVFDPAGNIASQYQLLGMPSSYLIDKQGNLRFSHKGFFTNKQNQYEQEITALLKEQE